MRDQLESLVRQMLDRGVRYDYRIGSKIYERTLGEAEPRPGSADGRVWRGEQRPLPMSISVPFNADFRGACSTKFGAADALD